MQSRSESSRLNLNGLTAARMSKTGASGVTRRTRHGFNATTSQRESTSSPIPNCPRASWRVHTFSLVSSRSARNLRKHRRWLKVSVLVRRIGKPMSRNEACSGARVRLECTALRCSKRVDGLRLGSGAGGLNSRLDVAIGIIVRFVFQAGSIPPVVLQTLPFLNVEELGKGISVLVTVGKGFCRDDVVN
jgi:hypothetical protein